MNYRAKKFVAVTLTAFSLLILFILLHNIVYALFGFEEPFFFTLALVIIFLMPVYMLFSFGCLALRSFGPCKGK